MATALIAGVIVAIVDLLVGLAFLGRLSLTGGVWPGFPFGLAFLGFLVLGLIAVLVYAWAYAVIFHMMLRRIRERRPAVYSDMQDFDHIGSFAAAAVVLGVIVGLGYMLFVIPGLFLTTIWVFALPLIADGRIGLSQAMSDSRELASRPGLFTTFATWIVGAIAIALVVRLLNTVPMIGLVAGLLAVPFGIGYVVSMYFQAIDEGHLIDQAIEHAQR
jgi:hypothetical protein